MCVCVCVCVCICVCERERMRWGNAILEVDDDQNDIQKVEVLQVRYKNEKVE